MRFSKVHPAFILVFCVSLLCLVGAVIWAGSTYDRCPGPGDREVTPQCVSEAEGLRYGSLALGIAGVGLMIGAVGFQVGRTGGSGMSSAVPNGQVQAGPPLPPQAPYAPQPPQGTYPPQ
jgi:hypothetical protein